jgi:hypothetical protein
VLRRPTADAAGATVQRGATGRVREQLPDGRYVIELADGREFTCQRADVSLRRAYQTAIGIGDADDGTGLDLVRRHTIYAAIAGSRAFGLATEASDTDVRGVYVAPTPSFWSLVKPPMHVDGPEPERVSWEVERFCELALKSNPNVLEVLWSPLVEIQTELGAELVALRDAFLSQLVYQTFSGYVLSQFKRIEADLRQHGQPRWKHVMHLLRLLLSARSLLREGTLRLDVGDERERLLSIKRGEVDWDEVEHWRLRLHEQLDEALAVTPLPPSPDVVEVDSWLASVRERSLGGLQP